MILADTTPTVKAIVPTSVDTITILRHSHNLLAKTWLADGTVKPYDDAKYFSGATRPVAGLAGLSELLTELQVDPHRCIIRGKYVGAELAKARDPGPEGHRPGKVRRALDYFDDQALHTVLLDVDKFQPLTADPAADPLEAIGEFVATMLPECFRSAGYHWQLSNSAGHPSKADGGLRAHLWFWLATPRTSTELKAWAKAAGLEVDGALFNPVQVHYTAAPVMGKGVVDPIAQRCGLVDGPAVVLEIDTAVVAQAAASGGPGGRGQRLREVASDDPIARRLLELDLVKATARDGFFIACPFDDGHTPGSGGESSTQYFLPNTGGHALGHFKCLHDSCSSRTRTEFLAKLGIVEDVAADFEELPTPDAVEEAQRAVAAARTAVALPAQVVGGETGELIELHAPQFSDDHLALGFAKRAESCLRITPGMGWMTYDGQQYKRDEHLHRYDLARSLCRDAAALTDKPSEKKALASAKTVNAVLSLAQSDRRLMVPAGEWDADRFALNTPDGVVDLRTGTMRPRIGDLVTKAARVSPDFKASCPHWLRFLDQVCASDADLVEFMRRMLGYMLTGDRREQKLFFIWGRGANGKTTLGELLLWMLGGYGLKLSSSVLMQSPHDRHPTELAQLQGARAAISSELEEGQFFNESRVKELTGDDTLSARFMRGDFFEFAMSHKHLVIGNHKPRLKGGDPALARRLVLIPFKASFSGASADQSMPAKLKAEAPAILAWMIRGAVAWAADGLALPAVVSAASDEYMADHNDVEQWIDECCDKGADYRGKGADLYGSFNLWKMTRGERAPSVVTWSERMSLIEGVVKTRSNGAVYTGVRCKKPAQQSGNAGADASEFSA
jgi:putative DNA primase/helicase